MKKIVNIFAAAAALPVCVCAEEKVTVEEPIVTEAIQAIKNIPREYVAEKSTRAAVENFVPQSLKQTGLKAVGQLKKANTATMFGNFLLSSKPLNVGHDESVAADREDLAAKRLDIEKGFYRNRILSPSELKKLYDSVDLTPARFANENNLNLRKPGALMRLELDLRRELDTRLANKALESGGSYMSPRGLLKEIDNFEVAARRAEQGTAYSSVPTGSDSVAEGTTNAPDPKFRLGVNGLSQVSCTYKNPNFKMNA